MSSAESNARGAVVCDLDGTLIDSLPNIHAAVNLVLTKYGERQYKLAKDRR